MLTYRDDSILSLSSPVSPFMFFGVRLTPWSVSPVYIVNYIPDRTGVDGVEEIEEIRVEDRCRFECQF